jgi:arylsulfate sulfotransferase
VIEIDRISGAVINEWDLKESLDEWRVALDNVLNQQYIDWAHTNAVVWVPADSSIIISCRVQGVFKLSYDNELIWVLGPHEGWGNNRQGVDLNDYLLTPISSTGSPLSDTVAKGQVTDPEFEWCWYQHAPFVMPNGNIMLFDNGQNRQFIPGNNSYSRAVEYEIDEENMTIRQVWQYGKERGLETFSRIVSDVDRLPMTGNILFSPGAWVQNGQGQLGAKIVEVDYNTREVIFEAKVHGTDIVFHRTERLTLYPQN